MSKVIKKIKTIVEKTEKLDVEKLSKDKNALSKKSPLMKLLIESVEMSMEVLETLPNLDKTKMKATLRKLLDDDSVKKLQINNEIIEKIEFQTEIMIDKLFETKKMVGGDEHTCSICLEEFTGNESRQDLVCCPNAPPCMHKFHIRCIEQWLTTQPRIGQGPATYHRCPECNLYWDPTDAFIHPDGPIPQHEELVQPNRRFFSFNFLTNTRRRANNFRSYIMEQMNGPNSLAFHVVLTSLLCMLLSCVINSTQGTVDVLREFFYTNLFLYGLSFFVDPSRLISFRQDQSPLISVLRVQQFIFLISIIDILVFLPLIRTNERIEPTPEEVAINTAFNIQDVTTMILNNSSDIDPNVRQMFLNTLVQQARRLMEHQDGGSIKARRIKSCKKRGRKSNRKKLNRKTRRKV